MSRGAPACYFAAEPVNDLRARVCVETGKEQGRLSEDGGQAESRTGGAARCAWVKGRRSLRPEVEQENLASHRAGSSASRL